MTDCPKQNGLGDLISKHIGAIISAIVMGILSYVIGTTKTGMTIDQMGNRLDVAEKHIAEKSSFDQCVTRHIDHLEAGIKDPPPCTLGPSE